MSVHRRAFLKSSAGLATLPLPMIGRGSSANGSNVLKSNADVVPSADASSTDIPGVVAAVTTRDETIYAGARGVRGLDQTAPMDMDTVMFIASMTKPLTSVAALQLVEQGKLNLDEPAANIIPDLATLEVLDGYDASGAPLLRAPMSQVTLRQLLTHVSGFAYDFGDANLDRYYTTQNVPRLGTGQKAALRVPLMFDPGTRWEYGIGVDWVGQLVEAASGMRLSDYFKQNITGPLGMDSTEFRITTDMRARLASMHSRGDDGKLTVIPFEAAQDPEFESGGAGLYSTANDYLKFLRMVLNNGRGNGSQIVEPRTIGLMSHNAIGALRVSVLRTAIPSLSRDAEFFPGLPKTWSLGFMINEAAAPTGRSAGSLAWAGLANTFFWIDPTKGIAGLAMMQLFPFFDQKALDIYYGFEKSVYDLLALPRHHRVRR